MTYETKFLAVGSGIFFSVIMVGVGFWFLGDLEPVENGTAPCGRCHCSVLPDVARGLVGIL